MRERFLNLEDIPVFVDSSLLWRWNSTYQNLKDWLSQKYKLQSFVFQMVPISQRLLASQLGGFECNFRCLKWFFRKLPWKLRLALFLKLRFLKIRLLVTWLKCLLQVKLDDAFRTFILSLLYCEFQTDQWISNTEHQHWAIAQYSMSRYNRHSRWSKCRYLWEKSYQYLWYWCNIFF